MRSGPQHLDESRGAVHPHRVAVGEGVTDWAVGDRVGVCPTGDSGVSPGYGRDGGFAPKHRVAAGDLVRMPDDLSFELAALGTDAGMTAYHAITTIGALEAGQHDHGRRVLGEL